MGGPGCDRRPRRSTLLPRSAGYTSANSAPLVTAAAPRLVKLMGVGPEVAGQLLITAGDNPDRLHSQAAFAHLCGVELLPASSGRIDRHRLNRGGDRAANCALYRIVLCRLRYDPATQAYVQRRTKQGLTKPEIIRCLKRYVLREVYRTLAPVPGRRGSCSSCLTSIGASRAARPGTRDPNATLPLLPQHHRRSPPDPRYELRPTFDAPHWSVLLDDIGNRSLRSFLAAFGSTRENEHCRRPGEGRVDMTTSSPATTRLDLHTFTDDLVWGYLDDARDPDQVVELWVGSRRHAVRARVEQRTDEPSGTIVTVRLLD